MTKQPTPAGTGDRIRASIADRQNTAGRSWTDRHEPARTHHLRPGRVYLCIGPNCWGKAFTPLQAEENAREEAAAQHRGRAARMPFLMFDAPPDVTVDGMGGTVYTPCLYQTQEQIDALRDPNRAPRFDDPDPKTIGDGPQEIYRWTPDAAKGRK